MLFVLCLSTNDALFVLRFVKISPMILKLQSRHKFLNYKLQGGIIVLKCRQNMFLILCTRMDDALYID